MTAPIRSCLVSALKADLVGPFDPTGTTAEVLPLPPSRWYLTGFLAPMGDRETYDPTADDEGGAGDAEDDDDADAAEPEAKQKKRYPASMGLSVLLPAPTSAAETVEATVRFAEYVLEERKETGKKRGPRVWRRMARGPFKVQLPLDAKRLRDGVPVPDTSNVLLRGELANAEAPGLLAGTRALSVFLVNERGEGEKGRQDEQYLFQTELELAFEQPLVARPNRKGEDGDWDDQVSDLQFRHRCEWAVGHGVSVAVPTSQAVEVKRVCTTWVPEVEVRRVATRDDAGETGMEALAQLGSADAVRTALTPIVDAYGAWLQTQSKISVDSIKRREAQTELIHKAQLARKRIAEGIELLATNDELRRAFQLMNQAMAASALQRSPERYTKSRPSWRLFQLAFVLLNIAGIGDEAHPDRENVELIFFPTGGGKTEAYLGVIGFTLVLRRLRGQARSDKGLGVAVLLRYTLRLLTLDQLGRAATLVCALEIIRKAEKDLGDERFAVGLWVGRTASANTLEQVKKQIVEYKNAASATAPSPFPLVTCPWCNHPLDRNSLTLYPNPSKAESVVVGCVRVGCEFSAAKNRSGLPVVFVDEQIYRELPSFLVATVDKFAMLPWRGETGMLFGRATARDGQRFFGPIDPPPKGATALPQGLRPPELIVQDELHLISGPLGTMVGLYETAIEYLSTYVGAGNKPIRPKVIASTATVRRASEQIRALFGRPQMALFPPPGVNDSDTWFARVNEEAAGRLYVGIAAQGRALKAILLRTYIALLTAAQRQYQVSGAAADADTYMTVAGYFNSLRELGGMRRLVEDDVRARSLKVEERRPIDHVGAHPWLANRTVQTEPVELTSRESTGKIKAAKDRLSKPHADKEHVDVLLASNMISVGVDIDRLGLMVVGGQPKTTSEYIQASSRVGRATPGLVVTCFNLAKPRDRSHYERFIAYHQSFYRFVEATSLTPFSGPALERGLTGALMGMTRLSSAAMTPATAAMDVERHRDLANRSVEELAARAERHDDLDTDEVERLRENIRTRGMNLIDDWAQIVSDIRKEGGGKRSYSRFDRDKTAGKPLLYMATDDPKPEPQTREAKFRAPTSMRDVEENVHLWVKVGALGGRAK